MQSAAPTAAVRLPKRPLAPLVVERWGLVATLALSVVVATAVATPGEHPDFRVLDAALTAAAAALVAWTLSRQRRRKIGVGPPVPPAARIDSRRKTIALAVARAPVLVLLVSAGAYDASPAVPILIAVLTAVLAWHTRELQHWEQRNGSRTYCERRFFERGTPFFYRSTPERLSPGSLAPSGQTG
jgi:hypothetical protein